MNWTVVNMMQIYTDFNSMLKESWEYYILKQYVLLHLSVTVGA